MCVCMYDIYILSDKPSKSGFKLSRVAQARNPSIWEVKAGESEVEAYSQLYRKLETSLCYRNLSQK